MAHLNDLVEEASTINSSITGVEYNNDHDHEDDDAMPSLLFFDRLVTSKCNFRAWC